MHQDSESSFRFNLRAPGVRALHPYLCLHLRGYLYLFLVLAICCSYLRLQVHLHVYTQRYITYVKSICNVLCMHMPPICAAHRIYIYTHTYICVCAYIQFRMCTCVYIYMYIPLSIYVYTYIHNYMEQLCVCMHICMVCVSVGRQAGR